MKPANPKLLLSIGFVMVTLGMILPFLLVMHILEPTYFLSFLSWFATVIGLFLGFVGSAMYVRLKKQ